MMIRAVGHSHYIGSLLVAMFNKCLQGVSLPGKHMQNLAMVLWIVLKAISNLMWASLLGLKELQSMLQVPKNTK